MPIKQQIDGNLCGFPYPCMKINYTRHSLNQKPQDELGMKVSTSFISKLNAPDGHFLI